MISHLPAGGADALSSRVTFQCNKPGDGERRIRMSVTAMTASKYEINHSPVIRSAAAMIL